MVDRYCHGPRRLTRRSETASYAIRSIEFDSVLICANRWLIFSATDFTDLHGFDPIAVLGLWIWRFMNAATRQPSVLEKLPQELQYLIDPVLRFGCRCESDAF